MTFSLQVGLARYHPLEWFATSGADGAAEALGFRSTPGGVHLTKTMMLAELSTVLSRVPDGDAATIQNMVVLTLAWLRLHWREKDCPRRSRPSVAGSSQPLRGASPSHAPDTPARKREMLFD